MLRVALLLVVCLPQLGAVRSRPLKGSGVAHKETNKHANDMRRMAEHMHHTTVRARERFYDSFLEVRQFKPEQAAQGMTKKELKEHRNTIGGLYNPPAALSLIKKTSYGKATAPPPGKRDFARTTAPTDAELTKAFESLHAGSSPPSAAAGKPATAGRTPQGHPLGDHPILPSHAHSGNKPGQAPIVHTPHPSAAALLASLPSDPYLDGFSEQAIAAAAAKLPHPHPLPAQTPPDTHNTPAAPSAAEATHTLIELDEGSQTDAMLMAGARPAALQVQKAKATVDWDKWQHMMLGEFDAATMDGTLDKLAHALPSELPSLPSDVFAADKARGAANIDTFNTPLHEATLVQAGAEAGKDRTDQFFGAYSPGGDGVARDKNTNQVVDKLCGCGIQLDPVCGSDGMTYPSACFAECAGLEVSHKGACLTDSSKASQGMTGGPTAEQEQYMKEMSDDSSAAAGAAPPSGEPSTGSLANKAAMALGGGPGDDLLADLQGPGLVATGGSVAGVDYPSLTTYDATAAARASQDESMQLDPIKMPFAKVRTQAQFNENLKALSRIADQFADTALDPAMSGCECAASTYDPVCGKDGRTYASICYASCMGVTLLHTGACRDNNEIRKAPATMDEVRDPICFCSLREKRVCGVDGKTYLNRCMADCVSMDVRMEGPCISGIGTWSGDAEDLPQAIRD